MADDTQVMGAEYGLTATFFNVASESFNARLSHPLQQTNAGFPLSISFTGSPIDPSRLLLNVPWKLCWMAVNTSRNSVA